MSSLSFKQEAVELKYICTKDLDMYLRHSFFKIKTPETNGKFEWKKIQNVEPIAGVGNVIFYLEGKKKEIEKFPLKEIEISFNFPETGAYNFKDIVLIYKRSRARQWNKGIGNATSEFYNPIMRFYNTKIDLDIDWSITTAKFKYSTEIISELFDSPFPSFEKSFLLVKKNKVLARAVTPKLFLSMGARDTLPIIWFGLTPVGVAISSKKIRVLSDSYYQELSDIFRDLKEPVSLEG